MLWEAWTLGKTYKCRPSSIYDMRDPLTAYYFDRAVFVFGTHVESKMDEAGEGAKNTKQGMQARTRVLRKFLGTKEDSTQGRYRDPAKGRTERI